MLLRGYSGKTTFVSSEVDSADVMIFLKVVKQGDVEYHLQLIRYSLIKSYLKNMILQLFFVDLCELCG